MHNDAKRVLSEVVASLTGEGGSSSFSCYCPNMYNETTTTLLILTFSFFYRDEMCVIDDIGQIARYVCIVIGSPSLGGSLLAYNICTVEVPNRQLIIGEKSPNYQLAS